MKWDCERKVFSKSQSKKKKKVHHRTTNQSGASEAWWAHNPQVPGLKPSFHTSDSFAKNQ